MGYFRTYEGYESSSRENRMSLKGLKYRTDAIKLCSEKKTHVST